MFTEIYISMCALILVIAAIDITYLPMMRQKRDEIQAARKVIVAQQEMINNNNIENINVEDPLDVLMIYEKRSWQILKEQLGKNGKKDLTGEEIKTIVITELNKMEKDNKDLKEEIQLLKALINSGVVDLDHLEETYYAMIEEYYNDSIKYKDEIQDFQKNILN